MGAPTPLEDALERAICRLDLLDVWLSDFHSSSEEPLLLEVNELVADYQKLHGIAASPQARREEMMARRIPLDMLRHIGQDSSRAGTAVNPAKFAQAKLAGAVQMRQSIAAQSATIQVLRRKMQLGQ